MLQCALTQLLELAKGGTHPNPDSGLQRDLFEGLGIGWEPRVQASCQHRQALSLVVN
jgi:hypothetical protein